MRPSYFEMMKGRPRERTREDEVYSCSPGFNLSLKYSLDNDGRYPNGGPSQIRVCSYGPDADALTILLTRVHKEIFSAHSSMAPVTHGICPKHQEEIEEVGCDFFLRLLEERKRLLRARLLDPPMW